MLSWAVPLLAACLAQDPPPPAPAARPAPGPTAETRFHRVHLKNGNFIDGDLLRVEEEVVVMRLKSGDVGINRDLVDRIELVKMKAAAEAPPHVELPAPKPAETAANPAPRLAAPPAYAPPAGVKEAVDPLASRLPKATPDEADALVRELSLLGEETHPYLAWLMESADGPTAERLGSVLAQTKTPAAAPFLRRLVKHPSARVRAAAVPGLASNGGKAEATALVELFKDASPAVRAAASAAVLQLDAEGAFRPLSRLVRDPEPAVRDRVIGALTAMADRPALKLVLTDVLEAALAKNDPPAIRADAAMALAKIRAAGAAATVRGLLEDPEPAVRAAAATALAMLGGEEAAEAVAARVGREGATVVRVSLSLAAERLKAKAAIPGLIAWLGEEEEDVRRAALGALRTLSGKDFGRDAEKWSAWWDAQPP